MAWKYHASAGDSSSYSASSRRIPRRISCGFVKKLEQHEEVWKLFSKLLENKNIEGCEKIVLMGAGYMRGIWFVNSEPGFVPKLSEKLLEQGFITLPSGVRGDVLSWTPPLIVSVKEHKKFIKTLLELL